jgi:pilus assembly protein CpaB
MIYLFSQSSKDELSIEKELVEDNLVSIYSIIRNAKKGDFLDKGFISIIDVNRSELLNFEYIDASDNEIPTDSVFKIDLNEGTFLNKSQYISPGDNDYIDVLLNDDELPYLYENVTSFVAKSLNLNSGDRISFISTMSDDRNVLVSGYNDIDNISSKIIINDTRVLQVLREKREEPYEENTSIVVALKPKEILKLELSKKISEVSIIPSSFDNKGLKINSSDILENKLRVRELRGRD